MAVTAIQGLRGTGQFDSNTRPQNWREMFTLLEPNGTAPLNALLAMTASESTDDPKFWHFRDELPDRKVTINMAAGAAAGVTALTIDASGENAFVVSGTLLVNATTGEVMKATADTTGTSLTVSRNIGGTTHAIVDNDVLFVAGFADKEAGNSPTPVMFDAQPEYNFTQIFKTSVSVSGTLQHTKLRTGAKEQEGVTKALKLHMSDIERNMFFGVRHIENETTSQPTRYTGGLVNSITNVIDAASAFTTANTVTEKEFDRTLVEDIFAYGSKQKLAFVGASVAAHLMEIGKNRWQPTQVSGAYGVSMTSYNTFAGDLLVHLHPMFRQVPGMATAMIILDLPNLRYRYMDARDTQLLRNVQENDFDGVKHYYRTECGLEMTQAKPHAYIKNWQKVS